MRATGRSTPTDNRPRRGRGYYRPALVARSLRWIIGVTVGVLMGGAGVAFAYWSGTGAGTATGHTGTSAVLGLSPGTPVAALYPGGATDVVLTVSNSNTFPASIASIALDTTQGSAGFGVDSAHAGCDLSTLSYTTQHNGTSGWSVAAANGTTNGTLAITLTGALSMSASAGTACQGATFTVFLSVS